MQTFVAKYIQRALIQVYGLKEIWVDNGLKKQDLDTEITQNPEFVVVDQGFETNGKKCNIFMSHEFLNPDLNQNRHKNALVLILG